MDDRRRFEDAYHAHSAAIVAYVARRTDPTTAADVVSETFMVAWRRVGDLPLADGQRAWLITIARNVLANARRSDRRRLRLVHRASSELERTIRDMATEPGAPVTGVDSSLMAALDVLDPDDRELLTLLAWDRLDRREISEVLGCSNEALRTRIHRARVRFRRVLDDLDDQRTRPHAPSPDETADTEPALPLRSLRNV